MSGNYLFQWRDKDGVSHRQHFLGYSEVESWYRAFKQCGWEQRTTLGIVGDCKVRQIRDGIVKNWWEAYEDSNLNRFFRLYLSFNDKDRIKSGFVKIVEI